MNVTLDQARALDALARHGTFAAAAEMLHKGHTAVLYALRTLEEQTELVLLDRRGYRTRLTPAGERVLEHCRKLLAAERELEAALRGDPRRLGAHAAHRLRRHLPRRAAAARGEAAPGRGREHPLPCLGGVPRRGRGGASLGTRRT